MVSLLILTFLVPAVLFSAVAGVYVDRIDRRTVLVATNLIRGVAFIALYLDRGQPRPDPLLNAFISTVTVFFAPAEAAMIPQVVDRRQLQTANGIFTITLNAAFAIGFALLGPFVVNIASPEAVILVVAVLYLIAAVFCFALPKSPPPGALGASESLHAAERAAGSTIGPAARRPRVHPGESHDRLVPDLPGDHRLAGRRSGRARSGLRQGDARARGQGLRRRGPAARVRHRHRHPPAQRVRPPTCPDGG